MTTTAGAVVNKALRLISVKVAGVDITDEEMADGIEALNDMMLEMAAKGLYLGYKVMTSAEDVMTTPDWANQAIKYNLAIAVAPEYVVTVSAALGAIAQEALDHIISRAEVPGPVSFPDTLPTGSGNDLYGDIDRYGYRFFPDRTDNDLLYETGDAVVDGHGKVIDVAGGNEED